MTETEWIAPTDVGVYGAGNAWVSRENIKVADGNASQPTLNAGESSEYIHAKTFGFDGQIPAGATILGVEMRTLRFCWHTGAFDNGVHLYGTSGVFGADQSNVVDWHQREYTYRVWGSPTDLWGTDSATIWSHLVSANFGIALSTINNSAGDGRQTKIDILQMKIHYAELSSAATVTVVAASGGNVYAKEITSTDEWQALASSRTVMDATIVASSLNSADAQVRINGGDAESWPPGMTVKMKNVDLSMIEVGPVV